MRPRVVQRMAVLLHFDEAFANELFAAKAHPALADDELALFLRLDPRAFRTDPLRPLRLLAALVEEYPVSTALVGIDVARGFLTSSPFRHGLLRGRLMADVFGDWLFARAGDTALIELAVSLARRTRQRRSHGFPGLARAPGVELARPALGTLAFWADARAHITRDDVAQGQRIPPPPEPAAREYLLVTGGAAGQDVASCAEELHALLSYARECRSVSEIVAEARRLGADHDAQALVDDLLRDGLLAPV